MKTWGLLTLELRSLLKENFQQAFSKLG